MKVSKSVRAAAAELGRRGGKACAKRQTPEERSRLARLAARARWAKTAPSQKPAAVYKRRQRRRAAALNPEAAR